MQNKRTVLSAKFIRVKFSLFLQIGSKPKVFVGLVRIDTSQSTTQGDISRVTALDSESAIEPIYRDLYIRKEFWIFSDP
jgi:hypothetical protein